MELTPALLLSLFEAYKPYDTDSNALAIINVNVILNAASVNHRGSLV